MRLDYDDDAETMHNSFSDGIMCAKIQKKRRCRERNVKEKEGGMMEECDERERKDPVMVAAPAMLASFFLWGLLFRLLILLSLILLILRNLKSNSLDIDRKLNNILVHKRYAHLNLYMFLREI